MGMNPWRARAYGVPRAREMPRHRELPQESLTSALCDGTHLRHAFVAHARGAQANAFSNDRRGTQCMGRRCYSSSQSRARLTEERRKDRILDMMPPFFGLPQLGDSGTPSTAMLLCSTSTERPCVALPGPEAHPPPCWSDTWADAEGMLCTAPLPGRWPYGLACDDSAGSMPLTTPVLMPDWLALRARQGASCAACLECSGSRARRAWRRGIGAGGSREEWQYWRGSTGELMAYHCGVPTQHGNGPS